jgi:phosphoserine aminotransferase
MAVAASVSLVISVASHLDGSSAGGGAPYPVRIMTDLPTIQLPAELLPSDGRFGSGPSKVRNEALLELGVSGSTFMGTSHRRSSVRTIVGAVREGLRELYDLPDGYEVVLGNGGATGFWDAAAFGIIEHRSQHVVCGEFSSKFAAVAAGAPHLDEPEIIEVPYGMGTAPVQDDSVDVYAVIHNETSTGVMIPIARPGGEGLMVVDATSAAGAAPLDVTQTDVYYFSTQKAFGAEGGLWLAICSPFGISRIERLAAGGRWIPPSLDLRTAIDNSRKDQTYNTPALATLFLLRRQIEWMLDMGGLQWAIDRSATSARTLYEWADARDFASPFVKDVDYRSTTVVTIDFDGVDADAIEAVLRANGIVDVFGYRKLGRNQLRVACFPNIEPSDIERLVTAMDHVVERL